MESQKKNPENEEIRVFDNGQNMDDLIIMIAYCCSAILIPIRVFP
mgnify:CR=1 FL=1|jgi:hypothetical protein